MTRYPRFIANALEAFDMGSFIVSRAYPGSRAIVRLGRDGVTAVEIDSSIDENNELTWNGTTLTIDLVESTINALRPGLNTYEISLVTEEGKARRGPRGEFSVKPSLPSM